MEKQCLIEKKSSEWKYKITLEPIVFIFYTATTISQNLELNLLLQKACQVYNVEDDLCETESESEIIVSRVNTWKLFFVSFFSVIVSIYAGPIVDRNPKRLRFLLFVPVLGQISGDVGNYLSTCFWSWSPTVTGMYNAVLLGCTGYTLGFSVLALSYLSYTSNKKERTVKIGYYYVCFCMGLCIGSFLSGFITEYLGFYFGFLLCIVMNFTSLVLGMKYIEDVNEEELKTDVQISIIQIFKQNWSVIKKKREDHKRLLVILSLLIYPLAMATPLGELSVLYLFLRHQFGWDAIEYGVYMSFKMIIRSIGALICTEVLKRRLQLYDATVGIIGCSSSILACICWLLIYYSWEAYAITVMGIFEKAIIAVTIAHATKCVEPHEYGKINSMFAMMYLFTPIVYPFYSEVYKNGIYTFPSSFFVISFVLMVPCSLIFCISWYYTRKIHCKQITVCREVLLK